MSFIEMRKKIALLCIVLPQNGETPLDIADMWHNEESDGFEKSNDEETRTGNLEKLEGTENMPSLPCPPSDSSSKQSSCKWFDVVDEYMHTQVTPPTESWHNNEESETVQEGMMARIIDDSEPIHQEANKLDENIVVCEREPVDNEGIRAVTVKRARREQQIKESLTQMVNTWRESLEVLKDSETKRVQTLQSLSSTMTGLLEILKK